MTSELANFAARLRESIAAGFQPEHFEALAIELFAYQFTNNPAYRKLCETRQLTPLAMEHWSRIPALPAAAFKELELTCLAPAERTAVFHSSGTTEQKPSRHYHSAESLAVYEASLWVWFARHFQSPTANRQLVVLTPPPVAAPHSSLVHMFETVRQKLGGASIPASRPEFVGRVEADGAWSLDFDAAWAALMQPATCNLQPATLLLGTAFSFVHLLDYLAGKRLRLTLPPGSRVMETGGYKNRSRSLPKAELHALITDRLGVPASHIVCEYGMSELSSQAYDASCLAPNASRLFHFPPWARVQIISPETGREVAAGETGLIRIFDLANVFSVLAIQTEDLGIRRSDGFELLGRAQQAEPRGCSLMTA
jgi:hypothetical protein